MRIQDHQKKDYFELKFQVVDAPYIQGPVGSFIERDTLLTTGDHVKTTSLWAWLYSSSHSLSISLMTISSQYCQARVQVQDLSQISNKRPGPGACSYNCNVTHPPPTHETFLSRITLKSLHVWSDYSPETLQEEVGGVRRRFGKREE